MKDRLLAGVDALGLVLDTWQVDALVAYVGLLAEWNQTHNLTAVRDPEEVVDVHLLDALAVLGHLRGSRVLDVGSGGGVPGMPIAIARRDLQVDLIECREKKCHFLTHVKAALGLNNVGVVCARVEVYEPGLAYDTVIARAWTQLDAMIPMTRHLVAAGGCLLAMKGPALCDELERIAVEPEVIELTVPGANTTRCLVRFEESQIV